MNQLITTIQYFAAEALNCPPGTQLTGNQVEGACQTNLPTVAADDVTLGKILNIFFIIVGFIAVFCLVFYGLKFITSLGDPEKVKQARKAIIYSAVGIAVAFSGDLIVRLLLDQL